MFCTLGWSIQRLELVEQKPVKITANRPQGVRNGRRFESSVGGRGNHSPASTNLAMVKPRPPPRKPGSAVSWQPCRPWHGAGALWSWARRSGAGQEGLGAAGTRSYIAFKNLCDLSGSCSCSSKNLLFFLVDFLFCRLSPTAANLHFLTYEGSVIRDTRSCRGRSHGGAVHDQGVLT